jgi:hypothetical protein
VDAGAKKALDLTIEVPVEDWVLRVLRVLQVLEVLTIFLGLRTIERRRVRCGRPSIPDYWNWCAHTGRR